MITAINPSTVDHFGTRLPHSLFCLMRHQITVGLPVNCSTSSSHRPSDCPWYSVSCELLCAFCMYFNTRNIVQFTDSLLLFALVASTTSKLICVASVLVICQIIT